MDVFFGLVHCSCCYMNSQVSEVLVINTSFSVLAASSVVLFSVSNCSWFRIFDWLCLVVVAVYSAVPAL